MISLFLYTCIIFSSNIAFSSSLIVPNIKFKKPIILDIFVAKYPLSPSSTLSFLISNTLIYVLEFAPILIIVPFKLLAMFVYYSDR